MAAYTANTTGNWNAASTWSGAGIPGSGDTATINSSVTVTVPDGYAAACGTSGATGTAAVTVSGTLIIGGGASGSLTLAGDLILNAASTTIFQMKAGSTLAFSTPSGSQYKWSHVNGAYSTVAGSAAARCTVNASGLGSPPYMVGVSGSYGLQSCLYCDFSGIGDSTHSAAVANSTSQAIDYEECTFAGCSYVSLINPTATSVFKYIHNKHSGTVGPYCLSGGGAPVARTSGTRQVLKCDFDGQLHLPLAGFTLQYITFRTIAGWTVSSSYPLLDAVDSLLIYQDQAASFAISANSLVTSNIYHVATAAAGGNVHFWSTDGFNHDNTFSGCVMETQNDSPTNSSMFCIPATVTAGTSQNVTFQNCIGLPTASNYCPGTLCSIQNGKRQYVVNLLHNTWAVSGSISQRLLLTNENMSSGNWIVPSAVAGTTGSVVKITRTSHGLSTGAIVYTGGFTNLPEINNQQWTITLVDANNFTLNGSVYSGTAWNSAGKYDSTCLLPGQVNAVKANLVHCLNATTGGYIWMDNSGVFSDLVVDLAPVGACDYNGTYNIINATPDAYYSTSGQGYSYNASAVPGSHDIPGQAGSHANLAGTNPGFTDPTRNLLKWGATMLGGSPTNTQVLDWVYANDPSVQIPALLAWVRAGFLPTSTAYQAASYPGDASTADANGNAWPTGVPGIGAMAVQVVTSNTARRRHRRATRI